MNIEIEDLSTWPKEFGELLNQNKPLISSYHNEDQRQIDQPVSEIMFPSSNLHEEKYTDLLVNLDKLLFQHKLVGYHCTRLIKSEISTIKSEGLKILSPNLIQGRIQSAYAQGYLSIDEYRCLNQNSEIQKNLEENSPGGRRVGMIWFCANRSTLKKSSGVYKLLGKWGGEIIYKSFNDKKPISTTLTKIGTPCVVKSCIPFYDLNHFSSSFAAHLISYVISSDIEYPEPSYIFDMNIKRDLFATEIIDVIEISDPYFEYLTNYSNWPIEYKIDF